MLSGNLVNALDMAAANGILDYDGAAFITGTQPRYMGSPAYPVMSSGTNSNLQQPQKDEMVYKNIGEKHSSNPLWKKLLFGALVVGLGIFGIKKLASLKPLKNVKKPDLSKLPSPKDCWTKVSDFFKNGWNKLFKKKTTPTT